MIKGVIFDMDGLMFDTEAVSAKCWLRAGKQMGVSIPPELSSQTNGLDAEHSRPIFERAFGASFDYYRARYIRQQLEREYVTEHGVPVKPGLFELLRYLKEQGILMAVASSSSAEKVEWYLRDTGADKYFSAVINGGMVTHGKPDPEIFLTAAKALGLLPCECLALEDSPAGIKSAHAAGMPVVMIPDIVPAGDEESRTAYAILPTLNDVIELCRC